MSGIVHFSDLFNVLPSYNPHDHEIMNQNVWQSPWYFRLHFHLVFVTMPADLFRTSIWTEMFEWSVLWGMWIVFVPSLAHKFIQTQSFLALGLDNTHTHEGRV